jgi:thiol-disulfide isomerase/thioredoxin
MKKISPEELSFVIKHNQAVFVFVSADWCTFCAKFIPLFTRLENMFRSVCRFVILDYDSNKEVMNKLEIEKVPSVLIFKKGNIDRILQGTQTQQTYTKFIEEALV